MKKKLLNIAEVCGLVSFMFGVLIVLSFFVMGLWGGSFWVDPLVLVYGAFSLLGYFGVLQVKKNNNLGIIALIVGTLGMYYSVPMMIVPVILMGISSIASIVRMFIKD